MSDYTRRATDWYKVSTRFPREARLLRKELRTYACFSSVTCEETTFTTPGREACEMTCDVDDGGGNKWFELDLT